MEDTFPGVAPPERDVILSRRALFVGAALVGIQSGPRAATSDEACALEHPPDAAALSEARSLYLQAQEAAKAADFEQAIGLFKKAYELSGNPRVLFNLGLSHLALQQYVEATGHLQRVVDCGDAGAAALAKDKLDSARKRIALISIENLRDDATVEIDGRVQDEIDGPIQVNPGGHVVAATTDDGQRVESAIHVGPGETLTINLESLLPPDCSANPALCMPCLSPPPPPPPVHSPHFGIDAGYATWFKIADDESSGRVGHGLRFVPYYLTPLSEPEGAGFGLRVGAFVAPTWTPDGNFVPVGGDLLLNFGSGNFSAGLGASVGYTVTGSEPEARNVFAPAPGMFIEPHVQFIAVRLLRPLSAGLRLGHHFSNQHNTREETFGLGHVNVGVWLSFALTEDCEDFEIPCPPRGIFGGDLVAHKPRLNRW